jgi:hypothetical protein
MVAYLVDRVFTLTKAEWWYATLTRRAIAVPGETESKVKRQRSNVKRQTSNVKRQTSNVKRQRSKVKGAIRFISGDSSQGGTPEMQQ